MDSKNTRHLNPDIPDEVGGPSMTDKGLDRIEEVRTRVVDTIDGFGKIVERAEPEFLGIANTFLSMHQCHERVLTDFLRDSGRGADKTGSIFGTVNRGLIEARSWFDRVDETMIDSIISGEKHVLEAYEQALDAPLPDAAATLLRRQMDDIDTVLRKYAT